MKIAHNISHSTGGTGVSPVQAQAEACGYHKLLFACNSVSVGRASVLWRGRPRPPTDMAARDGRPTNEQEADSPDIGPGTEADRDFLEA